MNKLLALLCIFAFLYLFPFLSDSVSAQQLPPAPNYSCGWSSDLNRCIPLQGVCGEFYTTGTGCDSLTQSQCSNPANSFLCVPNHYSCTWGSGICDSVGNNCASGFSAKGCEVLDQQSCTQGYYSCVSSTNCGTEGNICCGLGMGDPCQAGLVCGMGFTCEQPQAVGGPNEQCRANAPFCDFGYICTTGARCMAGSCGGDSESCCLFGDKCSSPDLSCNSGLNLCMPKSAESINNLLCANVGKPDEIGILTAIGCIQISSPNALMGFFLRWSMGIVGGTGLLLIIFGFLQLMTASGDPKKVAAARELITSAVVGMVFLLFSVFLLRTIGVSILGIFT